MLHVRKIKIFFDALVALVTVGSAAEVGDSIGIGTQGQSTSEQQ